MKAREEMLRALRTIYYIQGWGFLDYETKFHSKSLERVIANTIKSNRDFDAWCESF